MKKLLLVFAMFVLAVAAIAMAGCTDAEVASNNLSKAADQFEIDRRVVFFNGITDKYLLVIEGRASIYVDAKSGQLEVTVKTGKDQYKKHFLGLSDNVSYFVEQLGSAKTDVYHYRVIFKPETIMPSIDLETSGGQ